MYYFRWRLLMGKIIEMQDKINNRNIKKGNQELDTKGIKNFYNNLRLAYKPGIENEYNLTTNQKKFARNMRLRNFTWYFCTCWNTFDRCNCI